MKKLIWIIGIFLSIIASYCFYKSGMEYINNYQGDAEGSLTIAFLGAMIFGILILLFNLILHIIIGILGIYKFSSATLKFKDIFIKKHDTVTIVITKLFAYFMMLIYLFDFVLNIVDRNLSEVTLSITAIIVTEFYVMWFSAFSREIGRIRLIKN